MEIQRALLPAGLLVDAALKCSTPYSDSASMTYLLFGGSGEGVASCLPTVQRAGQDRYTGPVSASGQSQ